MVPIVSASFFSLSQTQVFHDPAMKRTRKVFLIRVSYRIFVGGGGGEDVNQSELYL